MDISIRSVDDASALSGKPFAPGDRVWSYLFRTPAGQVERIDILEEERGQLELEGAVICKWGHRIKVKDTSESEARRAALQSADEVFLSLFEEDAGEEMTEELVATRNRLKFFLALQLERKRVLKPLGNRRYRHMPTKREVTVPEIEISPEVIEQFREEISLMGGVKTG
ncbi:MAG: hypothetical protein ACP5I4_06510 [Oceanipulchritudo sp.]